MYIFSYKFNKNKMNDSKNWRKVTMREKRLKQKIKSINILQYNTNIVERISNKFILHY